jgi:hypothetical protein
VKSDNAFAPGPQKWNPVLVTSSDRQSSQGASGAIDIALAYRSFKPKLRYVFTLARIFASHKLSSSGVLKPEVVMTVFGMNIQIIRKCDGGTPNATHQNRTFILA